MTHHQCAESSAFSACLRWHCVAIAPVLEPRRHYRLRSCPARDTCHQLRAFAAHGSNRLSFFRNLTIDPGLQKSLLIQIIEKQFVQAFADASLCIYFSVSSAS
jgi:hypothetical protein